MLDYLAISSAQSWIMPSSKRAIILDFIQSCLLYQKKTAPAHAHNPTTKAANWISSAWAQTTVTKPRPNGRGQVYFGPAKGLAASVKTINNNTMPLLPLHTVSPS